MKTVEQLAEETFGKTKDGKGLVTLKDAIKFAENVVEYAASGGARHCNLFDEGCRMTQEQKQILREFDQQQEKLEHHLKALLERRREYINTNQLNKKVSVK